MENRLTFFRTVDYAKVREVMSHRAIYKHISDDFSGKREDFQPIENDAIWYVLVMDGKEVLGLFLFHPENHVCWKVHTCLLPSAWGPKAKEAGIGVIQWLFANSECHRIVTDVPVTNRLALKFALDCGMERYGFNPASFMKNGILQDQVLLGVSKD